MESHDQPACALMYTLVPIVILCPVVCRTRYAGKLMHADAGLQSLKVVPHINMGLLFHLRSSCAQAVGQYSLGSLGIHIRIQPGIQGWLPATLAFPQLGRGQVIEASRWWKTKQGSARRSWIAFTQAQGCRILRCGWMPGLLTAAASALSSTAALITMHLPGCPLLFLTSNIGSQDLIGTVHNA